MQLWTVANAITLFRLALLPVLLGLIYFHQSTAAIILFAIIWGLDAVDGYVARRLHQATATGSFLDKLTDRLLIVLTIFALIGNHVLPPVAILLLTKDMILILAIPVHKSRGERIASVGNLGKMNTFLQGTGLLWLLFGLPAPMIVITIVGLVGLYVGGRHLYFVMYPPIITV